jgi:hypothetical protein
MGGRVLCEGSPSAGIRDFVIGVDEPILPIADFPRQKPTLVC